MHRRTMMIGLFLVSLAAAPSADGEISLAGVDGSLVTPLAPDPAVRGTVALFVRTDCPISNRYAPEVRRIHETYAERGVAFWLVYPDPAAEDGAIREHLEEYGYPMPALKDPEHRLVGRAGASITPEAAVFDAGLREVERLFHVPADLAHLCFGVAQKDQTDPHRTDDGEHEERQ